REELSVTRHVFRASIIFYPFIGFQVDSKAYLFISDNNSNIWSPISHGSKVVSAKHPMHLMHLIGMWKWRIHFLWHVTLRLEVVPSYGKTMRLILHNLSYSLSKFWTFPNKMIWITASKTFPITLPFLSSRLLWNVFSSFHGCLTNLAAKDVPKKTNPSFGMR
ncbi:hypothetical protein Tco_1521755, partial [Tanacetum coccineum]